MPHRALFAKRCHGELEVFFFVGVLQDFLPLIERFFITSTVELLDAAFSLGVFPRIQRQVIVSDTYLVNNQHTESYADFWALWLF